MTSGGRIRTILAVQSGLVRGALAYVLRRHDDIEVVAETGYPDGIAAATAGEAVDVLILDLALGIPEELPAYPRILVLADPKPSAQLSDVLARRPAAASFLSTDVAPDTVVDAIRRMARGETVLDGELVAAALGTRSPLTVREAEVLTIAGGGWPVREIAEKLSLSPGTVRNHLSRALAKTGTTTRIEAVRVARESGWI